MGKYDDIDPTAKGMDLIKKAIANELATANRLKIIEIKTNCGINISNFLEELDEMK